MPRPSTAAVRELAGFKEPCLVATTANIDLAAGGLLTVDGATLVAGDRVLVKDQTDASENGIYTVSAGEWYRSPDAMSARNIDKRVMVRIQGGAIASGLVYAFDTLNPDIGTDDINIVLMNFGGVEIDYATVPETRAAAVGNKILVTELLETAAAFVELVDSPNISVDWDSGINFSVTLGGNRTLVNPSNGQPGTWRTFVVTQDATGTRLLTFDTQYKHPAGTAPTLTEDVAAVDVFTVLCVNATLFYVFSGLDMG